MNSSTGMPLSTWMFLNTFSAIGCGGSCAACAGAAAESRSTETAPSRHASNAAAAPNTTLLLNDIGLAPKWGRRSFLEDTRRQRCFWGRVSSKNDLRPHLPRHFKGEPQGRNLITGMVFGVRQLRRPVQL